MPMIAGRAGGLDGIRNFKRTCRAGALHFGQCRHQGRPDSRRRWRDGEARANLARL